MSAVLIAGGAATSAPGRGIDALFEAACGRVDALRPEAAAPYDVSGLRQPRACWLPPTLRAPLFADPQVDPATVLLSAVVADALESARLPSTLSDRARWGLWLGTSLGGIGSWQREHAAGIAGPEPVRTGLGYASPGRDVARAMGLRGPVRTVSTACCSATVAVGEARDALERGEVDVAIAGGVDVLCRFVHTGFDVLGALSKTEQRPFAESRDGLWLGEGAGVVVLRRAEVGETGVEVAGGGLAGDALRLTGPDPTGAGVLRAVHQALLQADLAADRIAAVSAHGTATVLNDAMEMAGLPTLLGERVADVPVHGIKPVLGHTLGASGIFEILVLQRAMETGRCPGTPGEGPAADDCRIRVHRAAPLDVDLPVALSINSAFAGNNAAVVLRRRS